MLFISDRVERVVLSILLSVLWLDFVVLWLAFGNALFKRYPYRFVCTPEALSYRLRVQLRCTGGAPTG